MSVKLDEITALLELLAPEELAEEWDNVGLIVGSWDLDVSRALIALDCTDEVIDEAIGKKAELIITHHPVMFKAIKKITSETCVGRRLLKLIGNGIAVYSAHTNLDIADGGTNDILFDKLSLLEKEYLVVDGANIGRAGRTARSISLKNMADMVASCLLTCGVAFAGSQDEKVNKLGLCTGKASGYKYFQAAVAMGCDTYLTGDVSYHDAQLACDLGLKLIIAPHFATEICVAGGLYEYLTCEAGARKLDIEFIKTNIQRDIINYISSGEMMK